MNKIWFSVGRFIVFCDDLQIVLTKPPTKRLSATTWPLTSLRTTITTRRRWRRFGRPTQCT